MLSSFGAARHEIHPASVDGKFTRRSQLLGRLLIAVLLILPWIRIQGAPIFLNELSTRQFFIFGQVFSPRDSTVLLPVILGAGFLLFFVTSLWGRLWCGYACPQTVLLEGVIRKIEKWTDGERGARSRLQKAPWGPEKIRKRALKWTLFALVSFGISMSFMGFFADVYDLWTLQADTFTYGLTLSLAFILFLDFAWFREQFCHYVCPYARLQGVMTDENTVQIGYDFRRGEKRKPRGLRLEDVAPDVGDCIDCRRCVTVCPSGIDIRDGFQLECIACARCVDACTDVLGKIGRESLVVYASQAELEGRPGSQSRMRSIIYLVGMLACAGVLATTLIGRVNFDVTVAQDPGSAESAMPNGGARNLYQITIHNNASSDRTFEVATDLPGARIIVPGGAILVEAASRRVVPAFVEFDADNRPEQPITPFHFIVSTDGKSYEHAVTFRNRLQ